MKISNMKNILKLAQVSNDTVHMVGKHGIGKSQIVETFAKENNIHIETLLLSQNEVGDLIGIPEKENGVMYWTKPTWLKRMEDANKEGKHCVLFLDELARSPLEVRQSALQLVLDRKIHEHKLPELDGVKTLVVAADNPADEYQTDELDPALLDRFMTFEVETDVKEWLKWARANNILPVITDFIADFPERLHDQNEEDKGATPRGWAKLSDILKNIDTIDETLIFEVIKSKIGRTVGHSFFHFYNDYVNVIKVEDIEDFLKDYDITTDKGQIEAGEKLKELTGDIEAVPAAELAEKIKAEIQNGKDLNNLLTTYLASLNFEVAVSIFKNWKTIADKGEEDQFYYQWCLTVPGKGWIFAKATQNIKL